MHIWGDAFTKIGTNWFQEQFLLMPALKDFPSIEMNTQLKSATLEFSMIQISNNEESSMQV